MELPKGWFYLTTRRGKQFNSMVWEDEDPLTGADRYDVIMSLDDARRLGLRNGDEVVVRNDVGEFRGRVRIGTIHPGNVMVFWPEANCLIPCGRYDPNTGEPDYNAAVQVLPAREAGQAVAAGSSGVRDGRA